MPPSAQSNCAPSEAKLASLGVEQLAVVNLRRMDTRMTILMPDDQVVNIEDQLAEVITMRDEGLIGGIGKSNTTIDGCGRLCLRESTACRTPTL